MFLLDAGYLAAAVPHIFYVRFSVVVFHVGRSICIFRPPFIHHLQNIHNNRRVSYESLSVFITIHVVSHVPYFISYLSWEVHFQREMSIL